MLRLRSGTERLLGFARGRSSQTDTCGQVPATLLAWSIRHASSRSPSRRRPESTPAQPPNPHKITRRSFRRTRACSRPPSGRDTSSTSDAENSKAPLGLMTRIVASRTTTPQAAHRATNNTTLRANIQTMTPAAMLVGGTFSVTPSLRTTAPRRSVPPMAITVNPILQTLLRPPRRGSSRRSRYRQPSCTRWRAQGVGRSRCSGDAHREPPTPPLAKLGSKSPGVARAVETPRQVRATEATTVKKAAK